jgi:hypothetical protein
MLLPLHFFKVGDAMITINLINGFKDAMKSQARV